MVRRVDPRVGGAHPAARSKRLIRALEVYFQTGKPLTAHFADTVSPLGADVHGWRDRAADAGAVAGRSPGQAGR